MVTIKDLELEHTSSHHSHSLVMVKASKKYEQIILSHVENDRDVSAYSERRRLLWCVQLACFLTCSQKGTPGFTHKVCFLQRVFLGAASDVTVVLGMRQSIGGVHKDD